MNVNPISPAAAGAGLPELYFPVPVPALERKYSERVSSGLGNLRTAGDVAALLKEIPPAVGSSLSAGGMSAGGMSAGGMSAGGMSAGGMSAGGIAAGGISADGGLSSCVPASGGPAAGEAAALADELGLALGGPGDAFPAGAAPSAGGVIARRQLLAASAKRAWRLFNPSGRGAAVDAAAAAGLRTHALVQAVLCAELCGPGPSAQGASPQASFPGVKLLAAGAAAFPSLAEYASDGRVDVRRWNAFCRGAAQAATPDMLRAAWVRSLFWAPPSAAGEAAIGLWALPERVLAGAAGARRNALGRVEAAGCPPLGETLARAYGAFAGLVDAFRLTAPALGANGLRPKPLGTNGLHPKGLGAKALGPKSLRPKSRGSDAQDPLVRMLDWFAALENAAPEVPALTGDDFLRVVGRRMERHARAYLRAAEEGLSGPAFAERVRVLANAPAGEAGPTGAAAEGFTAFTAALAALGGVLGRLEPATAPVGLANGGNVDRKIGSGLDAMLPFLALPAEFAAAAATPSEGTPSGQTLSGRSPSGQSPLRAQPHPPVNTFTGRSPSGQSPLRAQPHPPIDTFTGRSPSGRIPLGRSPLGAVPPEVLSDPAAGGAGADAALARLTFGSLLAAGVAGLTAAGVVTGAGPADPAQRESLERSGWRPYALRLGDGYAPYGDADALSAAVGLAADFAQLREWLPPQDEANLAGLIAAAMAEHCLEAGFSAGVLHGLDVLADPRRYAAASSAASGAAASGAVAAGSSKPGPFLLRVRAVLDAWQKRLPGFCPDLYPARGRYGEPVDMADFLLSAEGGASPAGASSRRLPGAAPLGGAAPRGEAPWGEAPADRVIRENHVSIPRCNRNFHATLAPPGGGAPVHVFVPLTGAEYDRLEEIAGRETGLVSGLERLVHLPQFAQLRGGPDGGRAQAVRAAFHAAQAKAKRRLHAESRGVPGGLADRLEQAAELETARDAALVPVDDTTDDGGDGYGGNDYATEEAGE